MLNCQTHGVKLILASYVIAIYTSRLCSSHTKWKVDRVLTTVDAIAWSHVNGHDVSVNTDNSRNKRSLFRSVTRVKRIYVIVLLCNTV